MIIVWKGLSSKTRIPTKAPGIPDYLPPAVAGGFLFYRFSGKIMLNMITSMI
jgi:hypothetical protein